MNALRTLAALLVLLVLAAPAQLVSVQRIRLTFAQEYSFSVNSSIEYIFDFVPKDDEGAWPTRLWVRSSGGEPAQPLLLTARQRSGALTWQLPYLSASGRYTFYELTRTLCYDAYAVNAVDSPDCADDSALAVRGAFSLHVSSACRSSVRLDMRATPLRDWRLPFQSDHRFAVDQTSPRAYLYEFLEGQDHVRLVIASDDDTCATVSVQNNSCPVGESLAEEKRRSLRMSMMRSGAVQLARSQFPHGFFVVALVEESDVACTGDDAGEPEHEPEWLWEATFNEAEVDAVAHVDPLSRRKNFTVTVAAALTRAQYAVASVVALAVFLVFYVAFLVLVLAQRFSLCKPLVAPKAVLADTTSENGVEGTDADGADGAAGVDSRARRHRRRRRDSNATLDSCDDSNSDEEPPAAPTDAGAAARFIGGDGDREQPQTAEASPTPFGLPAKLNVAALARRHTRTLIARSDRYLSTLFTVAVFYALPVLQFVVTFQIILNVSGSLDLCYYNFLCANPAGGLSDFNHVFSNLGYLLLGMLFVIQVRRRRSRRRRRPRHEEYGIPEHYGMLESLGVGIMVVGVLSASYHVCPNRLNFQFDTAFMYVLMVLSMVTIYQSRHPDINARAHATFGVLAVLIALVVWGVIGGNAIFWAVFTVLHIFTILLLSLHIYYVGQFTLDKHGLTEATRGLRELPAGGRPLYGARLALLLIANAVNWGFAVYGMVTMATDFAGHMLYVLLCNTFMYMLFYLVMKLLHGERLRWYSWLFLGSAVATWAPALYFFMYGSTEWSTTAAASRDLNHECKVLRFYDAHDLWHFLSAMALYLSFNALLTWDDGLSAVKRTDIAVF
ncbi:SID1 transmembrane family member 1-like isoform X2 [Hyposmocoma kahamanoa]|uniref:SID1 transmembrane family member 1-like isoform X2 n=1 Tax=Hyposmocoma kahamanoa TaxID=1477025 RepID=UPI000E6D6024|nr:SID1 transmembrane family member 1-like isoform X2 [Hyposmocoma kahamanoa]